MFVLGLGMETWFGGALMAATGRDCLSLGIFCSPLISLRALFVTRWDDRMLVVVSCMLCCFLFWWGGVCYFHFFCVIAVFLAFVVFRGGAEVSLEPCVVYLCCHLFGLICFLVVERSLIILIGDLVHLFFAGHRFPWVFCLVDCFSVLTDNQFVVSFFHFELVDSLSRLLFSPFGSCLFFAPCRLFQYCIAIVADLTRVLVLLKSLPCDVC